MKFGEYLEANLHGEWRFYYVDYAGLKGMLKGRGEEGRGAEFSERDEAKFVDSLEKEMEKVFDFRDVKAGELTRHVQHCENVVATATSAHELGTIEEEIGRITNELSLLAAFTRLNYTSFVKILKKHDKRTDFMLKPTFMLRLNAKPLSLEGTDALIYRLSKLYDKIRQKLSGSRGEEAGMDVLIGAGQQQQVFVRKTSKYWVHGENVTAVKCQVLKYLPVLIFPTKRRKIDLAVSSVYLDTDDLSLYRGRLEKIEGAMAIRLRWYGSDEPQDVWVERKVHREDWTGEVSVKSRFLLREKHVAAFIRGDYTAEDVVGRLRKDPANREEDVRAMGELAKEVQETITSLGLKPKLRTVYNRTAFQLPADARVRISLDTDLVMIREDGPGRAGSGWKREDIGTMDWEELSSREIYRFPHAILEVKLQTQAGQEAPSWVERLIAGPLVEEVPKFSKYIHGCSALFPSTIPLQPYWLPQMNVDIRKHSQGVQSSGSSIAVSDSDLETFREAEGVTVIDMPSEKTPLLGPPPPPAPINPSGSGDKRIHVPVRVEPKVFFANERTFLSWIHFSIFLGGIATALVGLGDWHARVSGYLFATVSILFTCYALYLYQWRAERIRQRDPGPYDDRIGPTAVTIIFVLAMLVNLLFTAAAT